MHVEALARMAVRRGCTRQGRIDNHSRGRRARSWGVRGRFRTSRPAEVIGDTGKTKGVATCIGRRARTHSRQAMIDVGTAICGRTQRLGKFDELRVISWSPCKYELCVPHRASEWLQALDKACRGSATLREIDRCCQPWTEEHGLLPLVDLCPANGMLQVKRRRNIQSTVSRSMPASRLPALDLPRYAASCIAAASRPCRSRSASQLDGTDQRGPMRCAQHQLD
jgi:hypothetical protein